MSWLNRAIANLAPGYALKREIARRRIARLDGMKQRSISAVSNSRMYFDLTAPKKSPDAAIYHNMEATRNHVRQLEYNNGFIAGPIKRIVNNTVGTGFKYQSRVRGDAMYIDFPKINEKMAEEYNVRKERGFKTWTKQADMRLRLSFNRICRVAMASLVRDGEVLAIGRESGRKNRIIPYCIELLEVDRLMTPLKEAGNPNIQNGIEYDGEGVPLRYFVLKRHPGDSLTMGMSLDDYEIIDAYNPSGTRKVMHLYDPMRPEQSRGLSEFASALANFHNMDRYQEAEIMAALEDACMTGIVTSPAAADWQANYTVGDLTATGEGGNDVTKSRVHEFAPLKWHYLNPGEEFQIHKPSRPNDQMGEMINQLLRGPSNSLDIPPEVLSQNWQGMNYSNARTVLLQFYLSCWVRESVFTEMFLDPVHECVSDWFAIKGITPTVGYDLRREDYLAHAWIAQTAREWVDPMKESQGKAMDVDNGFDSHYSVAGLRGYDAEEILEAEARYLKKKKDLAEKYGIRFPEKKETASAPADETEPEDNDKKFMVVK
jgi:lambda family phage portal protein